MIWRTFRQHPAVTAAAPHPSALFAPSRALAASQTDDWNAATATLPGPLRSTPADTARVNAGDRPPDDWPARRTNGTRSGPVLASGVGSSPGRWIVVIAASLSWFLPRR